MPSFRHVGHCKVPASFGQSTPIHFLFAGGSTAMFATRGRREISPLKVERDQNRERRKVNGLRAGGDVFQVRLNLDHELMNGLSEMDGRKLLLLYNKPRSSTVTLKCFCSATQAKQRGSLEYFKSTSGSELGTDREHESSSHS